MCDDHNGIIPLGEDLPPIPPPGVTKTKHQESRPSKLRGQDRFLMLNEFIDSSMAGLSRTEALVWLVLFRDARGDIAQTSGGYVARRIGIDRRTVTRAISKLRARGFLTIKRQGGLNFGANVYCLRSRGTPASS